MDKTGSEQFHLRIKSIFSVELFCILTMMTTLKDLLEILYFFIYCRFFFLNT